MHLDNKIEKENNQKGDFTMMKSQETERRNEQLMGLYDSVLTQLRKHEKQYLTCFEELFELDVYGVFAPGRNRKTVEIEMHQHEAIMESLNKTRIQLENILKNKA